MNDNQKPNSQESKSADIGNGPQRLSDSNDNGAPIGKDAGLDAGHDALAEAQANAEKFKNEYIYLLAEFENYKKNVIKERSDLRKYGSERLVSDLLNVLDVFETALSTELTPENFANFKKGIEMTASELKNVLQRHGVSEAPAKGVPFDPAVHEALSAEETDAVPAGTITQVFKKPYKLHDRMVRPGQVVVAKAKS